MTEPEFIPKEGTVEEMQEKIEQMKVREKNQLKKQQEMFERIEAAKEKVRDLEAQHKLHLEQLEEQRKNNQLKIDEKRAEINREKKNRLAAIKRDNKMVAEMRPRTIKERQINVQAKLEELGCDHIAILAYIAMGDNKALKTEEKIRVFERRAAATTLAEFTVPKLKAIEPQQEETINEIPVYVPKRGDLSGSRPGALPQLEDDEDGEV